MERLCNACGSTIKGRTDKKFCDDQCRSSFNNAARTWNNEFIKRVNKILRRNREILEKLNPHGKIKISYAALVHAGFDLGYHTHIYRTEKGNNYYFCYEYGYLKLAADTVLLVKMEKL